MFRLFLIVVLFCLFVLPAAAQTDDPACDFATIATDYAEQLSAATTQEEIETVIEELEDALDKCRPVSTPISADAILTLSGTTSEVLDPVDIPTGYYRIRTTSDGSVVVSQTTLAGECTFLAANVELNGGDAIGGADTPFYSEDCRAAFESHVSAPYVLEFIPLDMETVIEGLKFEGINPAVIGPLFVPEGVYRVTIENVSEYPALTGILLDGECDAEFFMIFGKEGTFKSSGCTTLWELRYVVGEWNLELEPLE